jgi:TPR repeat protein
VQGNANAQYNLGICYLKGKGVTKNLTQALYWFIKLVVCRIKLKSLLNKKISN